MQISVEYLVEQLSSSPNGKLCEVCLSGQQRQQILEQEKQYQKTRLFFQYPDRGLRFSFGNLVPPSPKSKKAINRGNFALILLSELSFENCNQFPPYYSTLLQTIFLAFDHQQSVVHNHGKQLLINIIHYEASKAPSSLNFDPNEIEDFLRSKDPSKPLWPFEDITLSNQLNDSSIQISFLINYILPILSNVSKQQQGEDVMALNEKWANESLFWALNCPLPHFKKRSLQFYRYLHPTCSPDSINLLLQCLRNSIAAAINKNDDGSLMLEVLHAIDMSVSSIEPEKIVLFTQLFWAIVGMLHVDYEPIFHGLRTTFVFIICVLNIPLKKKNKKKIAALKIIEKLLRRIDFADKSTRTIYIASIPNW